MPVCYLLKGLMARAAIILGASEMDTDEAVSSVIPSGMEYWSDT